MKHLLFIFIFSLSFTGLLFAQSKTGNIYSESPWLDGNGTGGLSISIDKRFDDLADTVLQIELSCIHSQTVVAHHNTIMDSYNRLSLSKSMNYLLHIQKQSKNSTCGPDKTIQRCLSNSMELKTALLRVRWHPQFYVYLKANYGFNEKEADKMIDFFEHPEKH